jgi:hypothetical protein
MLNYPRRDVAALAMEEVKRFLETVEPNSLLEKIIFVVYSSNDEFIYRNLLPIYYPPLDLGINRPLPVSQRTATGSTSASSASSQTPRRTLFGSIGYVTFPSAPFGYVWHITPSLQLSCKVQ